METVKFIDLFSGMGGIRLGFEKAFKEKGFKTKCLFSSEIKKHAREVIEKNFREEPLGDISKINVIPDFDFLLAGFPCQAFSSAGNRDGFCDTRGTLFFEVERILKEKRPYGFLLENVEGLTTHDNGNTFKTIINSLEKIGYKVSWSILNSKDFGLPQSRKRIYIVGTLKDKISLINFKTYKNKVFKDIQEYNLKTVESDFTKKLLSHYTTEELKGKAIKDKRGGDNNIHSWDFDLK
jgi:DNA (cytosine-5)-methyltransferase 1